MRRILMAGVVCAVAAMAQGVPQSGPAKELNDMMAQAGQLSAGGRKADALKILEAALIKTQKEPSLKGRDQDVLRSMGRVYVEANRPTEAVRVYTTLLAELKPGCVVGKPDVDRCADIMYDLGTAQMYANDFAGAVTTLQQAVPLYEGMIKIGVAPDYRLAKLKLEANTQSMLGAALFRSGNLAAGIAAYQKSVAQYTNVANNPESGEGLRLLARQSLVDAQNALKLLQDEQKRRAGEKKAADPPKQAPPAPKKK